MAVVELIYDLKAPSWVTGNTNVPKMGEPVYLTNGTYALGDGVTQVKDLTFYGGGGGVTAGSEIKLTGSTVSFKGGQRFNVLDYGLVGDGSTDDRSALNTLLNTTAPSGSTIYFPKATYRLASAISVTDKYFYFVSDFATILIDGNFSGLSFNSTSNITLFAAKNNFNKLIFKGTGVGSSQYGVTFGTDASKFSVLNCSFENLAGNGIRADILNSPNGAGGLISNCKFLNNNYGYFGLDGSEYVTILGCYFQGNTQCIETTAGNQKIIGNNMSRNSHGINIYAGPNDAHGIISGNDINHCGYALRFSGIVNGMTVSNNNIYSANISVVNSVGVVFSGGEQDVSTYYFTNSTGTRFENVTFIGTAGTQNITGDAPIYNNCFNLNGDAAINPNTFKPGYTLFTSGSALFNVGTSANGLKFQGLPGAESIPAIYFDVSAPTNSNWGILADENDFLVNASASVQIRISNSNKFNVNSTGVQITGALKVADGTQANGYVLTSDASGNASWQAAPGGTPALTSGRIGFGSGSNLLTSDASLTYDSTNKILTVDNSATGSIASIKTIGAQGSLLIESASDSFFSTTSILNGDLIFRPKGNEMARVSGNYVCFGASKLFYWDETNKLLYVNANGGAAAGTNLYANGNTQLLGSIHLPYTAKTTTYAVLSTDFTIDCTSGTFTVTLPTAVGCAGRIYNIKNSGAGVITVATTSSQTIDGSTTAVIAIQYWSITVQSTGANWIII